ncbi:putative zeaxanthin epoxidase [Helianthus annuus]|uniref:Zeaxanthin epoxidase n=1 Tax=Helianthus annuus TaxID=4232 RepID=A0A9K3E5L5_HELAN|nr:putative zeaxanthin epoxidase [Helianthus annuus]KAJ0838750.1 putative zeaxanthin epoxidase [Helianthus annuus]
MNSRREITGLLMVSFLVGITNIAPGGLKDCFNMTTRNFDLVRYLGSWYEVASFKHGFVGQGKRISSAPRYIGSQRGLVQPDPFPVIYTYIRTIYFSFIFHITNLTRPDHSCVVASAVGLQVCVWLQISIMVWFESIKDLLEYVAKQRITKAKRRLSEAVFFFLGKGRQCLC